MNTTAINTDSQLVDINEWLLNGYSLHDLISTKSDEIAEKRAETVIKFEVDSAYYDEDIYDEVIDRVVNKLKNIDYTLKYATSKALDDLAIEHILNARKYEHHMMRGEVIEALLAYEYACVIRNKEAVLKNGYIDEIDRLKTDDKMFDVAYTTALSSFLDHDEDDDYEFLRTKFYFNKLPVSEIVKILDTYIRIMISEFDKTDPIHYTLVNGCWESDGGIVERDENNQFVYDKEFEDEE